MKLKEYVRQLGAIAEVYPDLEVVYSSDDEGNSYQIVGDGEVGSLGKFEGNYHGDFSHYVEGQEEDYGCEEDEINAICIN